MNDAAAFFDQHLSALPIYDAFERKILDVYPDVRIRVQKTQISFLNRHLFACVSFARVKRKAEIPEPYLVITLGLPFPLDSERAAVKTEPYPGRWTTHFVIGSPEEIDNEFLGWVDTAYNFADIKR